MTGRLPDPHDRSAGYTLVEMLVALSVIAMTFAGLAQASLLMNRFDRNAQSALRTADGRRRLQSELSALTAGAGPFPASGAELVGDSEGFRFRCMDRLCGATVAQTSGRTVLRILSSNVGELAVPAASTASFSYVSDAGTQPSWPPTTGGDARLVAIEVHGPGPALLARADLWRQEPAVCRFDVIEGACRGAGR